MARITPKMSLVLWDGLLDLYNPAQLAQNFTRLDYHDHTPGKGVQIQSGSIAAGAVTRPTVGTWLQATSSTASTVTSTPAAITILWPVSFGDNLYTVTASPFYTATVAPTVTWWMQAKSATGITIYALSTGANITNVTFFIIGIHN